MLRHPPVMVRALRGAVFCGPLWRRTKDKAEALALQAVAMGLINVDGETRDALGIAPTATTADAYAQHTPLPHQLHHDHHHVRNDSSSPAATAIPLPGMDTTTSGPTTAADSDEPRPGDADGADDLMDLMMMGGDDEPAQMSSITSSSSSGTGGGRFGEEEAGAGDAPPAEAEGADASNSAAPVPVFDALTLPNTAEVLVRSFGEPGDLIQYAATDRKPRLVTFDVLDATLGGGHHSAAILETGEPYTRVVALDCDHAVRRTASAMRETFGESRFQFFPHRMSDIETLFGADVFDAAVIDPGPNMDQLDDLSRGFTLDDSSGGGHFPLDMRYGPAIQTTAAEWLQHVQEESFVRHLVYYGALPDKVGRRMYRTMRSMPPIRTSAELQHLLAVACPDAPVPGDLLRTPLMNREAIGDDGAGSPFEQHPWLEGNISHGGVKRRPFALRALMGIRGAVNNDRRELVEGVKQALRAVRAKGHVHVLTREAWEAHLVQWLAKEHPYAVLAAKQTIDAAEQQEMRLPHDTTLWTLQRTMPGDNAFAAKNALQGLTADEVEKSYVYWLSGANLIQRKGYPAKNFGLRYQASRDRKEELERIRRSRVPKNNSRHGSRRQGSIFGSV